jgi:hypothetical protein
VLFTNTAVIAFNRDGKVILEGWHESTGSKLWRWPLLPQLPPPPDLPQEQLQLGPCVYGTQMEAIQAVHSIISSLRPCSITQLPPPTLPSVCAALQERLSSTRVTDEAGEQYDIVLQYDNTAFTVTASSKGGRLPFDLRRIDLPSIPVLVAFYHACLGFHVKDMWLEAIKVGNCNTFNGLTYLNVARYCPDSDETILRHLMQTWQNVCSSKPSKPPSMARPPLTPLSPPDDDLKEIVIQVFPISKLYSGDTRQFPICARLGNQYVMIAYHTVGNLILQQAFATKADKHQIPAFNVIMTCLTARGLSVDLNIRDNKASADFKQVITETWRVKLQLILPDMHCRNKAEQMICHFKDHFLSILAGVNATFPLSLWDLLLPQAKLTINLLRQATANPKILAWEYLN